MKLPSIGKAGTGSAPKDEKKALREIVPKMNHLVAAHINDALRVLQDLSCGYHGRHSTGDCRQGNASLEVAAATSDFGAIPWQRIVLE